MSFFVKFLIYLEVSYFCVWHITCMDIAAMTDKTEAAALSA